MKIKIEEFFNLIENNGGTYKVKTPSGYKLIGNLFKKQNKLCYEIKLSNGNSLSGSEDHLVEVDINTTNENNEYINDSFWINLKNITVGDFVYCDDNNIYEVIEKTDIGIHNTYDLEVLDNERKYISNGIVSHNCGKTAIVEGLAKKIFEGDCPQNLANKRIVSLDMTSIVAGTKYRGQFEERMKVIIEELYANPDIIIFIDEIHTMIGAGNSSGSMDASNIFKPALSRGELQCIGATTLEEYRKNIEKDGALERRFQKVIVDPSTKEETLIILQNSKDKYEKHHKVSYSDDILKLCVELADRYITDREFPDKAFDIIDEVGARSQVEIKLPEIIEDLKKQAQLIKEEKLDVINKQKYEEAANLRDKERKILSYLAKEKENFENNRDQNKRVVTEDVVYDVVSLMTKIPINKITSDETQQLITLKETLSTKVIGQEGAVAKISRAIQRNKVGLSDPKKPIFSGLLIGNSGVGKTELAKQLAKHMFNSEDALIRLDMSEFSDKIATSKLTGTSPGYVGYEDGSPFLNKIKNKPYSVILLDEIEKAHPEIFNVFLQMLDEGFLTDGHGRKINFKNCIILMTSNVGTKVVQDFGTGVGFTTSTKIERREDEIKSVLEKELFKKFSPEFINRLDDIVYFKDLNEEDLLMIVDLELNKFYERIGKLDFQVEVDSTLKKHLTEVGTDTRFGARILKRTVQKWVDDAITEKILTDNPEKGSTFILTYNEKDKKTDVKIKKPTKRKLKQ
jgi:ATP-dependent Clp protease ATP-binding subunit ClpC